MMPNPNQVQAQNIIRRIAQDPFHVEAQKAAKALIDQVRGFAQGLTVEGILHTACAANPDDEPLSAVMRMDRQVLDAHAADLACREIFKAARQAEELRLQPFDDACATRLEQIQDELEQAHRDHRSKILGQDRLERLWRKYADKGLTRDEILKLEIPEPIPGRDFVAERNAWGFELEQTTKALTTERDAILRFKHTRNENALPASVLALADGAKAQA